MQGIPTSRRSSPFLLLVLRAHDESLGLEMADMIPQDAIASLRQGLAGEFAHFGFPQRLARAHNEQCLLTHSLAPFQCPSLGLFENGGKDTPVWHGSGRH